MHIVISMCHMGRHHFSILSHTATQILLKGAFSKLSVFSPMFCFGWTIPLSVIFFCAPEHQCSTRCQSQCRYLKKSATADGSPHYEDTNTWTSLWASYFIFCPSAFLCFFFIVYQIRLGNVLLLNTYLFYGIWLCRCENEGVLCLLTLDMWFLALRFFTMAFFQCFNLRLHVKTQQHCVVAQWNMIRLLFARRKVPVTQRCWLFWGFIHRLRSL